MTRNNPTEDLPSPLSDPERFLHQRLRAIQNSRQIEHLGTSGPSLDRECMANIPPQNNQNPPPQTTPQTL